MFPGQQNKKPTQFSTKAPKNKMARFLPKVFCILFLAAGAAAFVPPTSGLQWMKARAVVSRSLRMGYVPDGVSTDEYERIKKKETAVKSNLGRIGITKFQSRLMKAWQTSGASHLFPKDPKTTPREALPYIQRGGGSWDNSDLGAKLRGMWVSWTEADREYKNGGEERARSRSIWGTPLEEDTPWA
ncbi:unnamed protein product [Choristocarpus tenellus]